MNIKVYNGDTLYKEYSFPYSDRKVVMKNRNNQLIPATESVVYLKRMTGFAYYKLYPNLAQMKQIVELYTLQEAGYELRWVFGGERKVYIVSDFTQKKVGLKRFVDRYELDLTLEIVGNVYIDSNVAFYSQHFNIDAANVTELQANYPDWTIVGSPVGTDITVADSFISLNRSEATIGIKEDMSNYNFDNATFEWQSVTPLEIGGWYYIPMTLKMGSDKVVVEYYPMTTSKLLVAFYDNGSWHYGSDFLLSTPDLTIFDFKIVKNGKTYEGFYRQSGDWISLGSHTFVNDNNLSELYVYTAGVKVKYDKIQVTPDKVKI